MAASSLSTSTSPPDIASWTYRDMLAIPAVADADFDFLCNENINFDLSDPYLFSNGQINVGLSLLFQMRNRDKCHHKAGRIWAEQQRYPLRAGSRIPRQISCDSVVIGKGREWRIHLGGMRLDTEKNHAFILGPIICRQTSCHSDISDLYPQLQ
jgi:hypothetical protein